MSKASIKTSVPTKEVSIGTSREDLQVGDEVYLEANEEGELYSWTIAYKPEGSNSSFSGSPIAKSPGSFIVDKEGSYLVRLQLTTDDGITEQFVRLRVPTAYGELKLLAAGEGPGLVPVPADVTPTGWADIQNYNLLQLLSLVKENRPNAIFKRFDFDYTTPNSVIMHLNPGDSVVKVYVSVEEPFSDTLSRVSIGDNTQQERFVKGTDVTLSVVSKYELIALDTISNTNSICYYGIPASSVTGRGFILALIHKSFME